MKPTIKSKEWDGSGIPPVGTVCEYRLNEYDFWFTCKITYVLSGSDHCFVAWCDHLGSEQFLSFASSRYKLQLRKIKTQKQIAESRKLIEQRKRIEKLENTLVELGYCAKCSTIPKHHFVEPLSSCDCGTSEDYATRPLQIMQILEKHIEELTSNISSVKRQGLRNE